MTCGQTTQLFIITTKSTMFTIITDLMLSYTYVVPNTEEQTYADESKAIIFLLTRRTILLAITHIFTLCDLLRIRKGSNEETFYSFVDFQKAFDYVSHDFLFHKLINIGIYGKMLNSIKAIYKEPRSCVVVNDRLTGCSLQKQGLDRGLTLPHPVCNIYK